jgi:hypothetical protein
MQLLAAIGVDSACAAKAARGGDLEEDTVQIQNEHPGSGLQGRRERHQARRASAAEDIFKGQGTAGEVLRTGWLRSPWQPVGQLWKKVRDEKSR